MKHTDVKKILCLQTDELNEILSRIQRSVFIFEIISDLLSSLMTEQKKKKTPSIDIIFI